MSVLALVVVSRNTALRSLLRVPLPERRVSRMLGVDDVARCHHQRYAIVLIDGVTCEHLHVPSGVRVATGITGDAEVSPT